MVDVIDTSVRTFTDGKRRVATLADCRRNWSGGKSGRHFRCGLCGHRFHEGDGYRWQYGAGESFQSEEGVTYGVTSFLVCDTCDDGKALERWVDRHREFYAGPKWWKFR